MTNHGFEVFKECGRNTIKLRTSKRVNKDQKEFLNLLKGVQGDTTSGLDDDQIEKIMDLHMSKTIWKSGMISKILNNPRTIHLFAENNEKDTHNFTSLKGINSANNPVAIIQSITTGCCGSKKGEHFDQVRTPKRTHTCVLALKYLLLG